MISEIFVLMVFEKKSNVTLSNLNFCVSLTVIIVYELKYKFSLLSNDKLLII